MPQLQCSFCGKQEDRVRRLIAGPGVHICDECVELCQEILHAESQTDTESTPMPQVAIEIGELAESALESLGKPDLLAALKALPYRERRVLELRYGLGGEQPRTLEEVGTTFNLTREQVRKIENQVLSKLQ